LERISIDIFGNTEIRQFKRTSGFFPSKHTLNKFIFFRLDYRETTVRSSNHFFTYFFIRERGENIKEKRILSERNGVQEFYQKLGTTTGTLSNTVDTVTGRILTRIGYTNKLYLVQF